MAKVKRYNGSSWEDLPIVTTDMLASVATSGNYNDLSNKPTIPSTSDCLKNNVNGTITGNSSDTPLTLKSKAAASYIGFKDTNGTTLGYFGVNSSKKPVFYDTQDHQLAYLSDIPAIPTISVSATGTATDEVSYITISGTEKKLAGGSSITFVDWS